MRPAWPGRRSPAHPEAPGRVGVSVSDISRRAQRLCRDPRSALRARRRRRRGQGAAYRDVRCDRRMDGGAADLRGAARPSAGACRRAPSLDRAYGAFTTGDGKGIIVGIQNESANGSVSARRFSARPGSRAIRRRFCNNVQRVANRPARSTGSSPSVSRAGPARQVAALLDEADIAFGRLNSVVDLAAHPQLRRITAAIGGAAISLPRRRRVVRRPGPPCA